jgi:hypothetical protein
MRILSDGEHRRRPRRPERVLLFCVASGAEWATAGVRRASAVPGAVRPQNRVVGSPPLHSGQALALWLFLPVQPGDGTDNAASGAHHAWP